MKKTGEKEVWLRGQRNDIPILINGVAHAMLQAGEELDELLSHFPDENLWHKPVGTWQGEKVNTEFFQFILH